jgi:hypothetical protein
MTLKEVTDLLDDKEIEYSLCKFNNEKEFLKHIYVFPDLTNAQDYKVCALTIKCKNGYKDIVLQFNNSCGVYLFDEMLFGEFCFEMYSCEERYIADALLNNIYQVESNSIAIIVENDLDKKLWVQDDCYYLVEDNQDFGEPAFFRELARINRPKTALEKKMSTKKQYEIYTYDSYQCIIR